MKATYTCSIFTTPATLLLTGLFFSTTIISFAADEICVPCGQTVNVTGVFAHYNSDAFTAITGAGDNAAAFGEDINGDHFTVTIGHLPAGHTSLPSAKWKRR